MSRQAATAAAMASRSAPWPPYASSRSRCQRSSRRRACSCWPWISTSGPTVAGEPAGGDGLVVDPGQRAAPRRRPRARRRAAPGAGRRAPRRAPSRRRGGPGRGRRASPSARPSASISRLLPGPGLAGDDVQAGREGDPDPLEKREVDDRQLQEPADSGIGVALVGHRRVTRAGAAPSVAGGPRRARRPPARGTGSAAPWRRP